jgi:hypothetical protein
VRITDGWRQRFARCSVVQRDVRDHEQVVRVSDGDTVLADRPRNLRHHRLQSYAALGHHRRGEVGGQVCVDEDEQRAAARLSRWSSKDCRTTDLMPTYPDPKHAFIAARVSSASDEARHWVGNQDDIGEHHGAVRINENPCLVHLQWQSRQAGRTVDVGTFKLYPRGLLNAGYCREERKGTIRLRFVRGDEGIISIQANDAGPALAVGEANFG